VDNYPPSICIYRPSRRVGHIFRDPRIRVFRTTGTCHGWPFLKRPGQYVYPISQSTRRNHAAPIATEEDGLTGDHSEASIGVVADCPAAVDAQSLLSGFLNRSPCGRSGPGASRRSSAAFISSPIGRGTTLVGGAVCCDMKRQPQAHIFSASDQSCGQNVPNGLRSRRMAPISPAAAKPPWTYSDAS
jgi:hypothetical protein